MLKKIAAWLMTTVLVCSLSAGTALAFTDLDAAEQAPIMSLKEKSIVSGVDNDHFVPRRNISYAQSISLIVKGLNLTIDPIRFIKKPEASDYFTSVPNDAWYAEAMIIAKVAGLNIPKNVDPNATVTREQYADLLIHAMDTKGTYPVIQMFLMLADEDQVDPQYMSSLQRIYLHKIATLPENQMAYPKKAISRGEAAVWLNNAIAFVEAHGKQTPTPPAEQSDIQLTVEKVNEDVNQVTLTRQMPNPGYGFTITGIQFHEDGTATILYTITEPKPGMMYPQVITEAKAVTYVASNYRPIAQQVGGTSVNSSTSSTGFPIQ